MANKKKNQKKQEDQELHTEETQEEMADAQDSDEEVESPVHTPREGATNEDATARRLQTKTAASTKKVLDKEPKVKFMIPLAFGEPKGAYEEAQINGHVIRVRKGEFVDLPQSIAELFANSLQISMHAGSDMLLGREKDGLQEALS